MELDMIVVIPPQFFASEQGANHPASLTCMNR